MTEELTKAAQMAMVVLQHYIHGGSEYRKPAEAAIAALNRALTQRQEAQTERGAPRWTVSIEPVAVSGETDAHCLRASIGNQSFHIGPDYMDTKQEAEFFAEMFLHAIEVGHRASIPAPQQATPEPTCMHPSWSVDQAGKCTACGKPDAPSPHSRPSRTK